MDLSKKFLNKVRPIFGKKPSSTERTAENDISPDVLISPSLGSGDDSTAPTFPHFDGENIDDIESITMGRRFGALDLGRYNRDRQYPSTQQDLDGVEAIHEIQVIKPITSGDRSRRPVDDHDDDLSPDIGEPQNHANLTTHKRQREWPVPSGQPPMFNGLQNTLISGGTFIQNNSQNERIRPGLKLLQKRVATSAFHNSAHRVDPPRCHPDTRVAIQKQINDWILTERLTRQAWIMWMHGAAGAGKSAIMQSIAERCERAHIPLASFFFFRMDPTRNSMASFISTLVYQLIQKVPQARDEILMIIESNPLIFDESLESQLQKLVIQPLLQVQEHFQRYFVILIDGLDECIDRAHQSDLIKLLGTISRSMSTPVIFLIASRREPQIEAVFVRKQVSDLVLTLALDNSDIEQTSEDIRRFLTDKFQDIMETHLRRHLLSTDWPPVSAVEEIITKCSGQFIYASVVINYISSPRGNPAHLLDIVRGLRLRDPSSQNPFAHLDALYQHIFSQVEAFDTVLDLLAYILITKESYISRIEGAFLLEDGELEVCLADLTAVITCEHHTKIGPEIKFLHASLPDFLRDKSRSERYYIDVEGYIPKLLCMFLDRVPPILDQLSQTHDLHAISQQEHNRLWAIKDLLAIGVKPLDCLQQSFMTFSIEFYEDSFKTFLVEDVVEILKDLKQLTFNDEGQAYHHVLDLFAAELAKYWSLLHSSDKGKVRKVSDLLARISQIRQEEL